MSDLNVRITVELSPDTREWLQRLLGRVAAAVEPAQPGPVLKPGPGCVDYEKGVPQGGCDAADATKCAGCNGLARLVSVTPENIHDTLPHDMEACTTLDALEAVGNRIAENKDRLGDAYCEVIAAYYERRVALGGKPAPKDVAAAIAPKKRAKAPTPPVKLAAVQPPPPAPVTTPTPVPAADPFGGGAQPPRTTPVNLDEIPF